MKSRSLFFLFIYAISQAAEHLLQKKVLNYHVEQGVFAFLRLSFGLLIFSVLLARSKTSPTALIKKNIRPFIILGIGFSGFGILLKFWGLSLTTAVNASFIMSLSSVATPFFAFFMLGEKAHRQFYALVAMMLGGVYLVAAKGSLIIPQTGDLVILALAFLIGFMQVYGKAVLKTLTVVETSFGRSLIGALFLGLLIPFFSHGGFNSIRDISVWLLIMANGVAFSINTYSLYHALQLEDASKVGVFGLLVPVFTSIGGYFLLGEVMNGFQFAGGIVILLGSYRMTVIHKPSPRTMVSPDEI